MYFFKTNTTDFFKNLKEFKKAQKKLDAAKLMNKNAKGTEKILMQSNMILADIEKIISTEKKERKKVNKFGV